MKRVAKTQQEIGKKVYIIILKRERGRFYDHKGTCQKRCMV
jgi:hypothetical protein